MLKVIQKFATKVCVCVFSVDAKSEQRVSYL